ncbi:hypothetical protein BG015_006158 [Linnemannia schmuckeri]|uniref:Uncharacterized protein n=1 Tax=Linnemannia schmuckeri TaxID=64567 RepID=A0A9P5SA82_9FUNG|nr:hypothetical protein BG015_006158 [Linnemannia schmuckeri]
MTTTIERKPSQSLTSAGPLRISTPSRLAASQSNYTDSSIDTNSCFSEQRIPRSLVPLSSSSVTSVPAVKRALEIPEIVLLIQEQLDRPSLLTSLRIATLWHQVGRHLVWQIIDWDNTSNNATTAKTIEDKMVENSHRIRTLRCMFHSQAGISYVDSSVLLRTLLTTTTGAGRGRGEREGDRVGSRNLRTLSLRGHFSLQSISSRVVNSIDATTTASLPPPPSAPTYLPFCISTLAHLDIRPSVNSAVDLHLILDTAVGLRTLVVDSHGSFVDSTLDHRILQHSTTAVGGPQGLEANGSERHVYSVHESLVSLKIQHLKMSRQELEGVAARCPNLVEFQSLCSPVTLWRSSPGSQQQHQQQQQQGHQQQEQEQLSRRKSLVGALAKSCPKIQRFHVGLQQGGFYTDLVHDALTSFPSLISFGLPTTDCTGATMNVIKACQLRNHSSSTTSTSLSPPGSWTDGFGLMLPPMKGGAFLTSLTIMNVSSSEKVSQALHEFLCWTPYLKEFYAYNTTLYLEHMQSSGGGGGEDVETQQTSPDVVVTPSPSATMSSQQEQYSTRRRSSSSNSSNGGSDRVEHSDVYVRISEQESGSERRESEGTRNIRSGVAVCHPSPIDTLVSPPIISPSSSPLLSTLVAIPTSSTSCSRQQHRQQQQQQQRWACTGLETLVVRFAHLPWRNSTEPPKRSKDTFAFMAGLQKLKKLCIKEGLMLEAGREYDMLTQLKGLEEVVFTTCYPIPIKPADLEWVGALSSSSLLKKVIVRRQKANATLDRELSRWIEERGSGVKLSLQLTDCCEEEYRFS